MLVGSPGSTVGAGTVEESLSLIAECINRAHEETDNVVIVLENMVTSLTTSHIEDAKDMYPRRVRATSLARDFPSWAESFAR